MSSSIDKYFSIVLKNPQINIQSKSNSNTTDNKNIVLQLILKIQILMDQ